MYLQPNTVHLFLFLPCNSRSRLKGEKRFQLRSTTETNKCRVQYPFFLIVQLAMSYRWKVVLRTSRHFAKNGKAVFRQQLPPSEKHLFLVRFLSSCTHAIPATPCASQLTSDSRDCELWHNHRLPDLLSVYCLCSTQQLCLLLESQFIKKSTVHHNSGKVQRTTSVLGKCCKKYLIVEILLDIVHSVYNRIADLRVLITPHC